MRLLGDTKFNVSYDSAEGFAAGVIFLCPGFRCQLKNLARC